MIIQGVKVQGVKYSGLRTLASISDVIWWFDHRRLITTDITNRVTAWGSIASNYSVGATTEVPAQGPFYYDGEGIGRKGPVHGQGGNAMRGLDTLFVQRFHSGEKYALFSILYKDNNGSVSSEAMDLCMIRNSVNTSFSFDWRAQNRTGVNTLSVIAESESLGGLTNAEYNLSGAVYYGGGKANNVRMIVRGSTALSTNSVVMPVDNHLYTRMFRVVNWANALPTHLCKMFIAYNLNHLTDENIDNVFLPLFYATLKQDAEYSSIVTP